MLSEINALSMVVTLLGMGFLSSYELFVILSDNPFYGHELNYQPVPTHNPSEDGALTGPEN